MRNYFTNLRNPKRAVSLAVLSATFTLGSTVTYSQSTANESANEMVEEVLVTGAAKRDQGQQQGRTANTRTVNFCADEDFIGKIVPMRITEITPHCLRGEVAGAPH